MTHHTLIAWTLDPCKWTKGHIVLRADLEHDPHKRTNPGPTKTLCGVKVPHVLFNIEIGSGADHMGSCKRCLNHLHTLRNKRFMDWSSETVTIEQGKSSHGA